MDLYKAINFFYKKATSGTVSEKLIHELESVLDENGISRSTANLRDADEFQTYVEKLSPADKKYFSSELSKSEFTPNEAPKSTPKVAPAPVASTPEQVVALTKSNLDRNVYSYFDGMPDYASESFVKALVQLTQKWLSSCFSAPEARELIAQKYLLPFSKNERWGNVIKDYIKDSKIVSQLEVLQDDFSTISDFEKVAPKNVKEIDPKKTTIDDTFLGAVEVLFDKYHVKNPGIRPQGYLAHMANVGEDVLNRTPEVDVESLKTHYKS